MQIHLLSINQSELCLELRPRPPCSDQTSQLDPLRLSVSCSHDDRFTLQVSGDLLPTPLLYAPSKWACLVSR